jgi:hypothetical protein
MGPDPADIGRAAVEGIRRGDFYIVTHPPVRDVETRAVMARPRTPAEGRS